MRLSKAIKDRYTAIGDPEKCFFCDSDKAELNDTTPSHRASDANVAAFNGAWNIVKTCSSCWSKIHKANWIEEGKRWGVARGCMTIEQKRILCQHGSKNVNRGTYVLAFGGRYVIPQDMIQDAENEEVFYHQANQWSEPELNVLQPVLAMRMAGLPLTKVHHAFWNQIMPADDLATMVLDRNDIQKYLVALEISDVSTQ